MQPIIIVALSLLLLQASSQMSKCPLKDSMQIAQGLFDHI